MIEAQGVGSPDLPAQQHFLTGRAPLAIDINSQGDVVRHVVAGQHELPVFQVAPDQTIRQPGNTQSGEHAGSQCFRVGALRMRDQPVGDADVPSAPEVPAVDRRADAALRIHNRQTAIAAAATAMGAGASAKQIIDLAKELLVWIESE